MDSGFQQALASAKTDEQVKNLITEKYKLTIAQTSFIKFFVEKGENSRAKMEAAIEAGYGGLLELDDIREEVLSKQPKKTKSPEAIAKYQSILVQISNLMKRPKINEAIAAYRTYHNANLTKDLRKDVFHTANVRAHYDIREFADTIVGRTPEEISAKIKSLTPEQGLIIDGLEFQYFGRDANRFAVKIKWADRDKSLALLSKLGGLVTDKKEVVNKGSNVPAINITVLGDNNNERVVIDSKEEKKIAKK